MTGITVQAHGGPPLMLRSSDRPPSYRLHRPSGQAVVTLDNRDHYLGPHGSTASRREYDRLVGQWMVNAPTLVKRGAAPSSLTITELIARYWAFAQERYQRD